jgi:diguanylate cyclase (GGDEF)-like protein/PAS domain S-box-containing protein
VQGSGTGHDPAGWERGLLDELDVALVQVDGRGRVIRANLALARLLQLPAGDLVGFDLSSIGWPPLPDGPEQGTAWDAIVSGKAVNAILPVQVRPSTTIDLRVRARPHRDQQNRFSVLLVLADVSPMMDEQRSLVSDLEAYRVLAGHLGDIVVVLSADVISWASPSVSQVLGHRPEDLIGRPRDVLIHPDDATDLEALTPDRPTRVVRGRLRGADGRYRWFEATLVARFTATGDRESVYSAARDVDSDVRLQQATSAADLATATLQTALDASSDGFGIVDVRLDADGHALDVLIAHANAAAAALAGATPDQVLGRDLRDVSPGFVPSGLLDVLLAALRDRHPRRHRVELIGPDGVRRYLDTAVSPAAPTRAVLTLHDVTQEVLALRDLEDARRRAEHAATHDPLTQLANRVLLREHLRAALDACPVGQRVAVVYCDLNDFKDVNDTYGHAAGDTVLTTTADRLRRIIRPHDTAARIGGDEFCLVLCHLPAQWDETLLLTRIAERLAQPIPIGDSLLCPSASVGLVLADPHARTGTDLERLLTAADHAMYEHKARHRCTGT